MYDKYSHVISRNGEFAAGYKHCSVVSRSMPSFLFTTLRILRVTKGAAEWMIGSRVYSISKDDLVVVNNIEARQFLSVDRDELFECEIFAFLPTVFGSATDCLRLYYDRSPDFDPVIGQDMPYIGEIHSLLDMLAEAFEAENDPQAATLALGLLTAVTSQLIRSVDLRYPGTLSCSGQSSQLAAEIIESTIRYINENISSEFGVAELAKHTNLSRGYFSLIFRRYTGSSPATFINRCRVTNVIRLLCGSQMNVLDAAMASGFQSASGFYKTFRAVCGMSPGEYMKLRSILSKNPETSRMD